MGIFLVSIIFLSPPEISFKLFTEGFLPHVAKGVTRTRREDLRNLRFPSETASGYYV